MITEAIEIRTYFFYVFLKLTNIFVMLKETARFLDKFFYISVQLHDIFIRDRILRSLPSCRLAKVIDLITYSTSNRDSRFHYLCHPSAWPHKIVFSPPLWKRSHLYDIQFSRRCTKRNLLDNVTLTLTKCCNSGALDETGKTKVTREAGEGKGGEGRRGWTRRGKKRGREREHAGISRGREARKISDGRSSTSKRES